MTVHELVTSIIEQAQSIESMAGDNDDPELIATLRNIDGLLDVLATAIEEGEI